MNKHGWFKQAKFGMMIHWGLYALPAGEWKGRRMADIGEWLQAYFRIPNKEYEKLAAAFNPLCFNAEEWVQLAVESIGTPDDFMEFDEDGLAAIYQNLNKPPKITTTTAGRLREVTAFQVSAKSKMRLKGAMLIAKFYKNVGHPL